MKSKEPSGKKEEEENRKINTNDYIVVKFIARDCNFGDASCRHAVIATLLP
jgi:hypothetical protein